MRGTNAKKRRVKNLILRHKSFFSFFLFCSQTAARKHTRVSFNQSPQKHISLSKLTTNSRMGSRRDDTTDSSGGTHSSSSSSSSVGKMRDFARKYNVLFSTAECADESSSSSSSGKTTKRMPFLGGGARGGSTSSSEGGSNKLTRKR
jgi:hypothetical protein